MGAQEKTRQARTIELFHRLGEVPVGGATFLDIRNQIVSLNLPLVTTVLKKYMPYTEDQFQIGCLGLIRAAETFKIGSIPFSSYACFLIEREIHKDYAKKQKSFEGLYQQKILSLDDRMLFEDNEGCIGDYVEDEKASYNMERFIEDNSLQYVYDNIISPAIAGCVTDNEKAKFDQTMWQKLEAQYLLSLIYSEKGKGKDITLTEISKRCGVSITNIRAKHLRVMENIFRRMWCVMDISFTELFQRIRGGKRVPHRLLCLDPGKTTGWAFFEDGTLTRWGQLEQCYDDNNIDAVAMNNLLEELKPDFIVYEDYRVYAHKLDRHTFSPIMTIRLLGVIEMYCQIKGIPAQKQMAATAKNFCTDSKLKTWNFWKRGMRHSRDAIRHGCYFLLFYKRGEDII